MNYSNDLLTKIEELAGQMMAPREIAALLDIDEDDLDDEMHRKDSPVRRMYLKGYVKVVQIIKQGVLDAAMAGSPYSLQKSIDYLSQIENQIVI